MKGGLNNETITELVGGSYSTSIIFLKSPNNLESGTSTPDKKTIA